jgi:hypothetical protein
MIGRNLGANSLTVLLADSPDEAPKYALPEYRLANPTVDFIFEDENGQKYVAMLTGGLVENLAAAVLGMKQRTRDQNAGGH